VDGRVLDEDTNQGIPGAFVIVRWKGSLGANSLGGSPQEVCYHVEVVRSGSDGRYHVPAWKLESGQGPRYIGGMNFRPIPPVWVSAHAPTYQLGTKYNVFDTDVRLRKFTGTLKERHATITPELGDWSRCTSGTRDLRMFVDLWKAVYEEEKGLARNPAEQEKADDTLQLIDELEFGEEEAFHRAAERRIAAQRRKVNGETDGR
jgi:hypothetical protein